MTGAPVSLPQESPGEESRSFLREWLPSWRQMVNAVQLRFDMPPDPEDETAEIPQDSVLYASMRQGMGMIILAALVAGLLPFAWNWYTAGRVGTAIPLAELGQATRALSLPGGDVLGVETVVTDAFQTIAGLEPALFPGWLAAGVSSLGLWINWPLRWLALWIVYGLGVLLVAKLLGAPTTLQQFYTLTSYGFLPLVLSGLGFVPCLGAIAGLLGLIWAIVVYAHAVRSATRLSLGMSVLCTVLPAATVILLSIVVAIATAAAVVGLYL
jgi:hypothetical protein